MGQKKNGKKISFFCERLRGQVLWQFMRNEMTKVFFCRRCLPIKEGLLITMGWKKNLKVNSISLPGNKGLRYKACAYFTLLFMQLCSKHICKVLIHAGCPGKGIIVQVGSIRKCTPALPSNFVNKQSVCPSKVDFKKLYFSSDLLYVLNRLCTVTWILLYLLKMI